MRFLLLLTAFATAAHAGLDSAALQSLVANSPFGTPGQPAAAGPAAATPFEFRGTFVDGGERFFSIVDTATRRAEWVSLNESDRAYTIRSYDPERETILVDHQGRTLNLKLHSARIGSLPPVQTPAVAGQVPAPGTPAAATAAAPSASEAQRLAQVAEEIRRRRALRQQSANPVNAQPARQP